MAGTDLTPPRWPAAPTCSGRRTLAGYNDLATTHPDVAKEWHPTLNDLNSDQVGKGCIKQIWWQCSPLDTSGKRHRTIEPQKNPPARSVEVESY